MAETTVPALRRVVADQRKHTQWAQDRRDTVLGRRHLRTLAALDDLLDWVDGNPQDDLAPWVIGVVAQALDPTENQ